MTHELERLLRDGRDRWRRLTELLDLAANAPDHSLGPEILRDIVRHYRLAASDLARARVATADPEILGPLNALVGRGYRFVYGARRHDGASGAVGALRTFSRFLLREVPAAFRRSASTMALAALVFGAGALVGFAAVAIRPASAEELIPGQFFTASPRERVAEIERNPERIANVADAARFGAELYTHNIQVALLTFTLASLTLVGGLWLLFWNGTILGAVAASYLLDGVGVFFIAWVGPHGALELPAIVFAGATGLVAGRAFFFPGDRSRGAALRAIFPTLWRLLSGVAMLLVVAGLIEGSFSQFSAKTVPYGLKIAVAAALFVAMLALFFGRRAEGHE